MQKEGEKMDWKERLKQEYAELKERYEKLKAWNNKVEVKHHTSREEMSQNDILRFDLMRQQQHCMGKYLHILELRAELEGISLSGDTEPTTQSGCRCLLMKDQQHYMEKLRAELEGISLSGDTE